MQQHTQLTFVATNDISSQNVTDRLYWNGMATWLRLTLARACVVLSIRYVLMGIFS